DASAKVVADHVASIAQMTADAKKKADEFEEFKKKEEEDKKMKDAEIAALKKKVEDSVMTPEKLSALVADRANTINAAKVLLGDKAPQNLDTMDSDAIKKAVVDAQLGDIAKGWDANAINVAFTTLAKDAKSEKTNDAGNQPSAVADMQTAFLKPAP